MRPLHVPTSPTAAIHAGRHPDPHTGAVLPPIVQSTTFAQARVGADPAFTYSRASNPTVTALEDALAAFEGARFASAYATGMAAISTLCLATLQAGDHVVCSEVIYGGTVRLCREVLAGFGVSIDFVDTTDPDAVAGALTARTRLLILESPGNPTLTLTDIRELSAIAHRQDIRVAVDNTFLTGALQQPLDLGADVVIHSTTKSIEGHNATTGGALLTNDHSLHERLLRIRKTLGCIQSPFEAWLTLQGLKTLPLRIRQHSSNALALATWLESHEAVRHVRYPWLPSHPQYRLARRQQQGGGGLLAFEVVGGTPAGVATLNALRLCTLAENLGSVETLVTHPATMTHADVPREQRERIGISDGLIRLSVGLEDPEDIIADLEQALEAALARVREVVR
ncbi:MAG: PLP-dependent transferase [Phycisphaerales bacterium]|nr:PLP-dependent transferase [Phycisphaerales bacterium]